MLKEYLHGGKLGDIVFSIPAFRVSMCDVYTLVLSNRPNDLQFVPGVIIPLLESQGIRTRVLSGGGVRVAEPSWVDGDRFRVAGRRDLTFDRRRRLNGVERHLRAIGDSGEVSSGGWLSVWPHRVGGVCFVRSGRYRPVGNYVDWRALVLASAADNFFMGTVREWEDFQAEFKVSLPYVRTMDLLDAARILAACDYVVCNQTGLQAVTVGLRVPHILERCEAADHCIFDDACQWVSSDSFWAGPLD